MPKYIQKYGSVNGVRVKAYGKTEREAEAKLRQKMAEVMAHGQVLDGSTTVRKWAVQWLEVYVAPRDATPKSLEMYRQKLDRYILPAIGSMKLRDVRDTHLQKMLNAAN